MSKIIAVNQYFTKRNQSNEYLFSFKILLFKNKSNLHNNVNFIFYNYVCKDSVTVMVHKLRK